MTDKSAAIPRPPNGEAISISAFDITLLVSYEDDKELGPMLCDVWLNGAWVSAIDLFGLRQFDVWTRALDEAVVEDGQYARDELEERVGRVAAQIEMARHEVAP